MPDIGPTLNNLSLLVFLSCAKKIPLQGSVDLKKTSALLKGQQVIQVY